MMSTSSLDQLELQLEELEASADPHAAEQKFSASWRRKPGSQLTPRWRRESGANPSLKWGFSPPGNYGIPKPLWTIIVAEKGYFGLENGGVSVFAPGSFPRYLDPKLLITLSISPSGVLVAGEFTVYKRAGTTALSAHSAKNLILFSHLEGRGVDTNLPR
jgi:hypothetical protein